MRKEADERRNEILDAADELFSQRGLMERVRTIFSKRSELHGEHSIIISNQRKM